MKLHYNLKGSERKALVTAISQELEALMEYQGAPTFAFKVGEYRIDKDGTVIGPDNLDLEDALHQKGFSAIEREYDEPDTYESGLSSMGATPSIEDLDAEAAVWTEHMNQELIQENGLYDTFVIEIPKIDLTDGQVQNIQKLIESKRSLLTKALGQPLTVKDTNEVLQFEYPFTEDIGVGIIYSQLSTALVNYVRKHQRVSASKRQAESEKFGMRTFMIKLGMNGKEYSAARKWLCRNLSGNASFSSNASYAAMQSNRRNGGQTDEQ